MSADVHDTAVDVLTPLVGRAMATIYVAQAAQGQGKLSVNLEAGDVERLGQEIRRSLSPFATREVIDEALSEIADRLRR